MGRSKSRPLGFNLLIYDDCCTFCTGVAKWVAGISDQKVTLVPVSSVDSGTERILSLYVKTDYRKDVHFIEGSSVYSKGSAVAHVLAQNSKLEFLSYLNDNYDIFKLAFDFVYFIAKKIKKQYNNLCG